MGKKTFFYYIVVESIMTAIERYKFVVIENLIFSFLNLDKDILRTKFIKSKPLF